MSVCSAEEINAAEQTDTQAVIHIAADLVHCMSSDIEAHLCAGFRLGRGAFQGKQVGPRLISIPSFFSSSCFVNGGN